MKISKNNTGLSSEYFVAAELYRRGYNVGITMGNAKGIDILAEKDEAQFIIQVKGIQSKKSICWNLKRDGIKPPYFYIFVNLSVNTMSPPEYFILTSEEAKSELKLTKSGRDYIDRNALLKKQELYLSRWDKLAE
jgi:hypothetical protein